MTFAEEGHWGYDVDYIFNHHVFEDVWDGRERSALDLFVWFKGELEPHIVGVSYFWNCPNPKVIQYLKQYGLWDSNEEVMYWRNAHCEEFFE